MALKRVSKHLLYLLNENNLFFFSEKEVKGEAGAQHFQVLQSDRTCAVFLYHAPPFTSSPPPAPVGLSLPQ